MTDRQREKALIPFYDGKLEYYSPASAQEIYKILWVAGAPITGRMLDVGCGDGRAYGALKGRFKYVGVDYSEQRVLLARQCFEGDDNARFIARDLYDELPHLDSESFELVWCCELLEHLENPEEIWDLMKVLCKPGGKVVCTCPVNMPHEAHLHVWKDAAELQQAFPDIKELRYVSCKTPGGHWRRHFVFTWWPSD